jgi:hypothetical protein
MTSVLFLLIAFVLVILTACKFKIEPGLWFTAALVFSALVAAALNCIGGI